MTKNTFHDKKWNTNFWLAALLHTKLIPTFGCILPVLPGNLFGIDRSSALSPQPQKSQLLKWEVEVSRKNTFRSLSKPISTRCYLTIVSTLFSNKGLWKDIWRKKPTTYHEISGCLPKNQWPKTHKHVLELLGVFQNHFRQGLMNLHLSTGRQRPQQWTNARDQTQPSIFRGYVSSQGGYIYGIFAV